MASQAAIDRRNLANEVIATGFEAMPCCTPCRNAKPKKGEKEKPKCIVGPRSGRCSQCIIKGIHKKCDVKLSAPEWTKFRDTRERLRKEIEDADEDEIKLLMEQQEILRKLSAHKAKKIRLKKQLRLAENRTESAVAKELEDLEAAEAVEEEFLPLESESGGVELSEEAGPSDIWNLTPSDWIGLCDPSFPLEGLESFPVEG
jgi:hypothetical protein